MLKGLGLFRAVASSDKAAVNKLHRYLSEEIFDYRDTESTGKIAGLRPRADVLFKHERLEDAETLIVPMSPEQRKTDAKLIRILPQLGQVTMVGVVHFETAEEYWLLHSTRLKLVGDSHELPAHQPAHYEAHTALQI